MSAQAHLDRLIERHEELERMIRMESHHPQPNEILMHQWKKEKLHIKDEIESLRSKLVA